MAVLWVFASSDSLGLYNVIPLFFVKEKGMDLEMANAIFGFSRIGGFFVTLLAGFFADRFGAKRLLLLLLLTTGVSTISVAVSQAFPLLGTALFVQATFSPGFFPVALVAISKLTSLDERSIFTGATMAIGVIAGLGLTPPILGAVADVWNFKIGIFALGILTLLSCRFIKGLQKV